ncbi:exodeoxyribonuclease III [Gelidibacter salicanalis]|uniref:Exodeoxyribonuclease III n=1 Tax=Gelidibacter salicanalis TaxID=291193 RepID=A0A934KQ25_9FLAO|nr:exodeoxyribonuclease III [Gelidibacter salicanalis]MBJ7880040.1 exodeoxyribonuclease III [Gelidibacter salicanalis]
MKIISYNVNGIRAALNKGFIEWLKSANPDVICLQEIKAMKEQVDVRLFEDAGYKYHYWFSAQKKGYSGVAILSKIKPDHVEYGTGIPSMDFEGRNIRVDFPAQSSDGEGVSVMSLYLPSGTNDARLQHKFDYMDMFQTYIDELKASIPNLIVLGDYNICHEAIDIHNPKGLSNVSGFLPVERQWIGSFMKRGFIDSFRHFNKEPDHYTWWSYRANSRARNKGWRLDYALVNAPLQEKLKRSVILSDAVHSDHCPILLEIED